MKSGYAETGHQDGAFRLNSDKMHIAVKACAGTTKLPMQRKRDRSAGDLSGVSHSASFTGFIVFHGFCTK